MYSMAWQRGGGEAGFLRAAAAMTFLAITDTPNSSSGTSCKAPKVWGDREWKGSKSGLFCLFHGEELKPVVWVVPETGDLNPVFDQWLWLSCVERGPKPWCQHVGKSKLSEVAKMFLFLFFIIKQNSYSLWSVNTGSSGGVCSGNGRRWRCIPWAGVVFEYGTFHCSLSALGRAFLSQLAIHVLFGQTGKENSVK